MPLPIRTTLRTHTDPVTARAAAREREWKGPRSLVDPVAALVRARSVTAGAPIVHLALHPDERVPLALLHEGRLERTQHPWHVAATAVWQRAVADAEAEGVLWSPLIDAIAATGTYDYKLRDAHESGFITARARARAGRYSHGRRADEMEERRSKDPYLKVMGGRAAAPGVETRVTALTAPLQEAQADDVEAMLDFEAVPLMKAIGLHATLPEPERLAAWIERRPALLLGLLRRAGVGAHQRVIATALGEQLSDDAERSYLVAGVSGGWLPAIWEQLSERVERALATGRINAAFQQIVPLTWYEPVRKIDGAQHAQIVGWLDRIQKAARQTFPRTVLRLAEAPAATPEALLACLDLSPSRSVRQGVARHPAGADPHVVRRLAESDNVRVLETVAGKADESTFGRVFSKLAGHDAEAALRQLEDKDDEVVGAMRPRDLAPVLGVEDRGVRLRAMTQARRMGKR